MNELIRKISLQAGFNQMGIWKIIGIEEYHQKFAELIIKECIDTVLDCTVEYATRPQIVQELKEHFGVEE